MPSLAILSLRGVGIVPPYAPNAPQPTLSTRMKTMLGFCCAAAGGVASIVRTSKAPPNVSSFLSSFICYLLFLILSQSDLTSIFFSDAKFAPAGGQRVFHTEVTNRFSSQWHKNTRNEDGLRLCSHTLSRFCLSSPGENPLCFAECPVLLAPIACCANRLWRRPVDSGP